MENNKLQHAYACSWTLYVFMDLVSNSVLKEGSFLPLAEISQFPAGSRSERWWSAAVKPLKRRSAPVPQAVRRLDASLHRDTNNSPQRNYLNTNAHPRACLHTYTFFDSVNTLCCRPYYRRRGVRKSADFRGSCTVRGADLKQRGAADRRHKTPPPFI